MPKPPLPPELEEFLAKPNPAVIATVNHEGAPHTAATWYLWEDGQVLVNMDEGRKRLDYIRRDSRVSITVMDEDNWYYQVTLRGSAELSDDADYSDIDRISRHYTDNPYPDHERGRVSARIKVESWYGWAASKPWTGGERVGR